MGQPLFFFAPFLLPFVRHLFLPTAVVLLREPKGNLFSNTGIQYYKFDSTQYFCCILEFYFIIVVKYT